MRNAKSGRSLSNAKMSFTSFKKTVRSHYRAHGRHTLPWRKTRDPYKILVSEIMLQQTQVERVIPFYRAFLKQFPTARALAKAQRSAVIRQWQGLGYNRRAKYLHEAAKEIVARHAGKVPREYRALVTLPGVGAYTAAAVRAFAWNEPDVFIETNIRSVFIRHFFPKKKKVRDAELLPYLKASLSKDAREWYWALMDYGAYLKKTEGNAARRSAHHTRQKPFKGSEREVRGAILKALSNGSAHLAALVHALPFPKKRLERQIKKLLTEELIAMRNAEYKLFD